ncbi:PqiB family protein [Nitrincola nitratireducens]|uniref:Mce/MlaD domain-containing protein n=1 Tax=Nitrincola nitratireducens TaxID=1229521 RepID=W9VNQ3_9GAMM|nr:MlaD family protein [Nitrincola nitratireducens]EXJ12110.1 hypothetical protein D791_00999 [Nitrincola nitratireducens]
MTDSDTTTPPNRAVIRQHRGPSVVWLLPLLAAIIAGWLVYKSYTESGIMISVVFDSAEGLEAGKTRVMYKGLPAGEIRQLTLNEDLQSITALIEMNINTEDMLTDNTLFWLVKPQVSLSGVSGLETLISGYYIGIQPAEGESKRSFTALTSPPPPERDEQGLYITLYTDSARSIQTGSPVYFRNIEAGRVIEYSLSPSGEEVLIDVYIQPEFTAWVTERSRFWNASGIEIDSNLPDFSVRVGSLMSILTGGIHFDSPAFGTPKAAVNGDRFPLYPDLESSRDDLAYQPAGFEGISFRLRADSLGSIQSGSPILFKGIKVGQVTGYQLNTSDHSVTIYASLRQRYSSLVKRDSRFWNVSGIRSSFNLQSGFSFETDGLKPLISGGIAFDTTDGPSAQAGQIFTLFNSEAESLSNTLAITLEFPPGPSLLAGSQIRFRNQPVGEIVSVELSGSDGSLFARALLFEQGFFLARQGTRFWIETPQIGLSGIQNPTGLVFGNHVSVAPGLGENSQTHFVALTEAPVFQPQPGLNLVLTAPSLGSLNQNSKLFYRGISVGKVIGFQLSREGHRVEIYVNISPRYQHLITQSTQFRNIGGIRASASLFKGVDIDAPSIEALLSGGIEIEIPYEDAPATEGLHFPLQPASRQ